MKLLSCYVSSFGTLKDFSYDFKGGLNVVKEENGWGKSTFAAFIKAMFYGLDDAKRTLEENERKRFAPWNSTDKFGGNLVFEWKGQEFKIERFFGAKASDDTVKLYDLATNKVYTEGSAVDNIGKRIFSIDEEGFLSTTYFSQRDFEIKSNTSITAKYNEVCEIQDSEAFDKALDKLDDRIKELKSRGEKGRITELKRSIVAINEDIDRTVQSVKTIESLNADLDIIKRESETLESNIKTLTERLEAAGKRDAAAERKKRYDAIKAELKELTDKKSRADAVLGGKTVTATEIQDCEKCVSDLKDATVKAEAAKSDLAEYAGVRSDERAIKTRKPHIAVLIAALIVALVGAVIAVTSGFWGLIFVGVGAIIAIAAIVVLVLSKNKTANEERGNKKLAEIYERKKRAVSEYENSIKELSAGLNGYFAAFDFNGEELSFGQKINAIKEAVNTSNEAKAVIIKRSAELKELENAGVSGGAGETESVSELNDKLKTATLWYKNKVSEGERIKTRIAALEAASDSLTDMENRRAELTEKLIESERELKILTLTSDYMKKADETLKTRYRAPLQNSLNKYFKMIAGEKFQVAVDTDMKVSVNALGAERETEFFSKGYRNLFEICKRFALTDILFTAEKPFIILDDPFSNLDDEKTGAAIELVKKLSSEYQIIYLVCHESRRA